MDTLLAIAHHILVFGLAMAVAMQLALVKPDLSRKDLALLSRSDAAYGLTAVLVIAVGVARVFLGAKGVDYYAGNAWFWAKMTAFAAAGLLSIGPTVAYRRWLRRLRVSEDALPLLHEVAWVRRIVQTEAVVLLLVPVFAALMARYQG